MSAAAACPREDEMPNPPTPDTPPLTIVAGIRKAGTCSACRRPIVWVVTAPKGAYLPFDNEPLVLSTTRNAETGVRFERVSRAGIHFESCPAPRPHRRVQRAWSGRRG